MVAMSDDPFWEENEAIEEAIREDIRAAWVGECTLQHDFQWVTVENGPEVFRYPNKACTRCGKWENEDGDL